MSLQRIAVISAVSAHNSQRNRTFYNERQSNETNFDSGINFPQHFNVLVGGASLSFVIMLLCVMCYCFNKSINKNSMAVYRRHLMEATNNQNVDIYTVEQFYETESYVPLCEPTIAQGVLYQANLPPSYEDVMASEKAMLSKYVKMCKSHTCCEHSHLNRSNIEQTNNDTTNVNNDDNVRDGNAKDNDAAANPNENEQLSCGNLLDNNGNEIILHATSTKSDCSTDALNGNDSCCSKTSTATCECEKTFRNKCLVAEMDNTDESTENMTNENNNPSTKTLEKLCQNETATDAVECNCQQHMQFNSSVEFDVLSDNGIVRMDMSKIIDRTGLPTYDAAIKLESFGYV